jgi:transcriptional regulator with XRE-family HTH domain
LSVERLEAIAKVSQSALTKAENGRSVPAADNLARIAGALDAPMDYFFQEDRDPDPAGSAAQMSYDVFARDARFTVQQRQRCAAALKHSAAPRTADAWRAFCEMVDLVLGPPGSQGLELVRGKKRKS